MKKIFTVLSAFFIALSFGIPVLGEEISSPPPEETSESVSAEESTVPEDTVPADITVSETAEAEDSALPDASPSSLETNASPETIPTASSTEQDSSEPEPSSSSEPVETSASENSQVSPSEAEKIMMESEPLNDMQTLTAPIAYSQLNSLDIYDGETGRISNDGIAAQYDSQIAGYTGVEIMKIYKINDHPVYCIQPGVDIKSVNGVSALYTGKTWDELTPEARQLCKRIAFFGYGHPMTGEDSIQYVATQMLIWEAIGYEGYQEIYDSICPTELTTSWPAKTQPEKRDELFQAMQSLKTLVNNYDKVPSFAGTWRQVSTFSVPYQKELVLTDDNHVLDWFQEFPEESHEGIEITVMGNKLILKINSLYYEGSDKGKTVLTFRRNPDQWSEMENGIIMYTSGENQHLIGESGVDPVHDYQIAISLKKVNLHLKKEDEYGSTAYSKGTGFLVSFSSDTVNGILKDPVCDKDGSPRIFICGEDGIVRIDNLLPAGEKIFLQEYSAEIPLVQLKKVYSVNLPEEGTKEMTFTDPLQDAELLIHKVDEEDSAAKINGAVFTVYETNDLPAEIISLKEGLHDPVQIENTVTYEQVASRTSLLPGNTFSVNGKTYEIVSSEEDRVTLKETSSKKKGHLSRYSLPLDLQEGSTIHTLTTLKKHGTSSAEDDEKDEHDFILRDVIVSDATVLLMENNGVSFQVSSSADVTMERLASALKVQKKEGKKGEIVFIGADAYEILSEDKSFLQPVLLETVSLEDPLPAYDDLPDPASLKEGDTVTLAYPWISDDGNIVKKEITFTCKQNNLQKIILENDDRTYEIQCPQWISREDFPQTAEIHKIFRVLSIEEPAYRVEDITRGNIYYVYEDRSEITKKASEGYSEMNGYNYDVRYRDVRAACSDAIHSDGCPVGTRFTKNMTYKHSVQYDGPALKLLSRSQLMLKKGDHFDYKGRRYDIEGNTENYYSLKYTVDGVEYHARLEKGSTYVSAYTYPTMDVTFVVAAVERTRRVKILQENPLNDDGAFTVCSTDAVIPLWSEINDHDMPAGRVFYGNDQTTKWQVKKNEKGMGTIIETDGVRAAVYPDHTEDISPLSWQEYADFENGQGKYLQKDDVMEKKEIHPLDEGDFFSVGRHTYQLLNSPGSETIMLACWNNSDVINADDLSTAVILSIDFEKENQQKNDTINLYRSSSISMQEVLNALHSEHKEGSQITIGSTSYQVAHKEKMEDGMHVRVKETESGKEYEILEVTGSDPFSYQQYLDAPNDLVTGMELTIRENRYTVSHIDESKILLKGEDGMVSEVTRKNNAHSLDYVTFLKPYQAYNLHDLFHESGTYELAAGNPHITLHESSIISDGNTFADVLVRGKDQSIKERKSFFFGTDPHEGSIEAVPAAHGISGHQYLRIYDEKDHNYPVANKEVIIFHDQQMNQEVCRMTSDTYGMVDVSELSAGTYYFQDNNHVSSFEVKNSTTAAGEFSVSHLKAGREYMVCEEELPEGYDYGHQQACTFITLNDKDLKSELTFTNRLRRLRLIVNKTDQDHSSTPLNGAWFSVTDLTYSEEANHEDNEQLNVSDIPSDAATGDVFSVWNALKNGRKYIWRIEDIDKEKVCLSQLDNGSFQGRYVVPVSGSSAEAPMLYRDLIRSTHTPRKGIVFQTTEKEPYENLKNYRILSITTRDAQDLFGKTASAKEIYEAVVVDEKHPDKPIHVYEKNRIPAYGASIGEFISGGILVSETEKVDSLPLSWEEAVSQANGEENLQEGMLLNGNVRHTAAVPSFDEIDQSAKSGKTEIQAEDYAWKIVEKEWKSYRIETESQLLEVEKGMQTSGISWTSWQPLTITRVWNDADGQCTGISVESREHLSWFIGRNQKPQKLLSGKPGVKVQILQKESGKVLYSGMTGMDGRLVYTDVPDGDYIIVKDGKKEEVHCEKGMITLPEIRYGHTIKVCETKSPLGYVIGDACTVITPKASYGIDTVSNYRPNAKVKKIITVTRKKVKDRKTGISE